MTLCNASGARSGARRACLALVGSLLLARAVPGQLLRLHCGDLNGYPAEEPGYVTLGESGQAPGAGLFPGPLDTVHVATFVPIVQGPLFPSNVATIDPDRLGQTHRFSSLVLADKSVLTLDGFAPDTAYDLRVELGALSPWREQEPDGWKEYSSVTSGLRLEIQQPGSTSPPVMWQAVADDVRCSTGFKGASLDTVWGGIVSLWVRCRSDVAGRLRLRFSGGQEGPVLLCAVEVHAHEPLPVIYRRTSAGPLQAQAPELAAFVAAFNAGDLDGAQALALALPDAWQRGVALLQLVGWLDGSRDGRVGLLPAAREALEQAQAAGHAGAPFLLGQVDCFSLALDHLAARGYESAKACPDEGGTGFLNPDCAGQSWPDVGQSDVNVNAHIALRELSGFVAGRAAGATVLDDLVAWNSGSLSAEAFTPSPLAFRAAKEYGLTAAALNPQQSVVLSIPGSVEMHQRMVGVLTGFVDLGFFSTDFPREVELLLLSAFTKAGSHPKDWPASQWNVLDEEQLAAAWWAPDVPSPVVVRGLPSWIGPQRAFLAAHRAFERYWLQERLVEGQFGGGQGDDVELLLQLWPTLAAMHDQGDAVLLARLDDAIGHALEEWEGLANGYFAGPPADVEHNAEYTTDP